MALADIFGKVWSHMDEALPGIGVLSWTRLGSKYVYEYKDFPRIVAVPTKDSFGPPEKFGVNPKSELTTREGFDIRIWAMNYDQCRAFKSQFILSLRYVCGGACAVVAGSWTPNADRNRRGEEYVLQVTIDTPVVHPTLDEVQIDASSTDPDAGLEDDGRMVFPSGQEVPAC